jgi:hypothetical protein
MLKPSVSTSWQHHKCRFKLMPEASSCLRSSKPIDNFLKQTELKIDIIVRSTTGNIVSLKDAMRGIVMLEIGDICNTSRLKRINNGRQKRSNR